MLRNLLLNGEATAGILHDPVCEEGGTKVEQKWNSV